MSNIQDDYMSNNKKRDRGESDQISPPHKMTKGGQQFGAQPSNSDLMAQLDKLMTSNAVMMDKITELEKRFTLVEKLFQEVEDLKKEVERLSKQAKPNDAFMRFEVEQKKKCVLVKGLRSLTDRKYESRNETYDRVSELFSHIGLSLTLEDYQRLGPIKSDDPGSTLVRLQFWSKDDKAQIYAKFKEFSDDPSINKISLINDYPLFQLAQVKKLSEESFRLRQKNKQTKTRIVPRGLEVQLQTRNGNTGKWTTVSQKETNGRDVSQEHIEA